MQVIFKYVTQLAKHILNPFHVFQVKWNYQRTLSKPCSDKRLSSLQTQFGKFNKYEVENTKVKRNYMDLLTE